MILIIIAVALAAAMAYIIIKQMHGKWCVAIDAIIGLSYFIITTMLILRLL